VVNTQSPLLNSRRIQRGIFAKEIVVRDKAILVIDDDTLVRETIMNFLSTAGFKVDGAGDGTVGIAHYSAKQHDLVVTDILMPGKEGIETIMDLRRINPGVKIIAISGQGWSGPVSYLDMAKQLGADSALSKPFSKSELLQAVDTVMNNSECHPVTEY
jgi:DNA-binding response OmpR family regulator